MNVTVNVRLKIDWDLLREQRDYISNEAANKREREGELLSGLEGLLDAVADAVYDKHPELLG